MFIEVFNSDFILYTLQITNIRLDITKDQLSACNNNTIYTVESRDLFNSVSLKFNLSINTIDLTRFAGTYLQQVFIDSYLHKRVEVRLVDLAERVAQFPRGLGVERTRST